VPAAIECSLLGPGVAPERAGGMNGKATVWLLAATTMGLLPWQRRMRCPHRFRHLTTSAPCCTVQTYLST